MTNIVFYIRPELSSGDDLLCIQAINNDTNKSFMQEISNGSLNEGIKSMRDILKFMETILTE